MIDRLILKLVASFPPFSFISHQILNPAVCSIPSESPMLAPKRLELEVELQKAGGKKDSERETQHKGEMAYNEVVTELNDSLASCSELSRDREEGLSIMHYILSS
ncbi:hypothetical protein NDU88_003979 [Pleurodeles waltl]|uniref:Uncharacterized protein n=1 Tax=Pleurodeles waltl TaxID=8319 RepID=A0AAV7QAY0_PLEWA|nr:hypothetical protein NDU88_003979 [Pleurodeles waltl]